MLIVFFQRSNIYKVQLLMAIALLSWSTVLAQDQGEMTFKANCMACHTIGSGRMVGPDLKGVNDKYEEEWLISFIKSSQSMVAEGDERAVKIFNEYMIPMPDQPLTDDQTKELLSYIKGQSTPVELDNASVSIDIENVNDSSSIKTEIALSKVSLGYLDILFLSVMGFVTIIMLILISLLFVLIKNVRNLESVR